MTGATGGGLHGPSPIRADEPGRIRRRHCRDERISAFVTSLPYTESVKIWLDLPDAAVKQLAEEGRDLSRAALEALAIDAYRMNRLTGYQLCRLLEIPSRDDLDEFLKRHGVPLEYTIEDFEREGATSARLWQKQQTELSTGSNRERQPE